MPFGLEDSFVVFDDNNFATQRDVETDRHYHEERIEVKGILNYGLVAKDEEAIISLTDNTITVPIVIDSIVAMTPTGGADEIMFTIYKEVNGTRTAIGKQRFSNAQMPVQFPDGIITPNMAVGVMPTRSDCVIRVYVKPVKILFEGTLDERAYEFLE